MASEPGNTHPMGCLVLIPPPLVTPLPGELIQGPDGEGREGAFVGCPAPRPPFPPSAMLCGGLSQPKAATAETQQITQEIKSQLEEKESRKFDIFDAVSYKTQVVAGINYFIKVVHVVPIRCYSINLFLHRITLSEL
uniref:Cystatin domain-containing protein n=1 Tax=Laticauda laticaudata TaxID=8630 RepID=A0A8C5S5A0_LATLA